MVRQLYFRRGILLMIQQRPVLAGSFIRHLVVLAVFGVFVGVPAALQAGDTDATGTIRYRQTLMEGIGSDMGAISAILKYELPIPASIEGHALSMAALAEIVPAAFKAKVVDGPTDSKAEIWSDAEAFQKACDDFIIATSELVEVSAGGDAAAIGAQLQAVGKTCGGCHKSFRKPKEESFRNQGDSDSH